MYFEISRNSFRPVPNVDSCFLSLIFRDESRVIVKNEEVFFKLIRTAFNQRRKTLRNSLDGLLTKEELECFFKRFEIGKNVRPEQLSLEQFADLNNYLDSVRG
ncbi:MAG: hypothetical protein NT014_00480 [Candidatus Omnitrophica bacterium]|nr:hypothetical protein [Candidatus Omnitrophota bacterium]